MSHPSQTSVLPDPERLSRALLDAGPTAIYIFDLDECRPLFVSPRGLELIGLSHADSSAFAPDFMFQMMHPDDQPIARAHFQQMATMADGETRELEYRMHARDGEWRWFRSRDIVFARDFDGRPRQVLRVALDITERKRLEETLRESEERFRTMADNTPVIIWSTDAAGGNEFVNRAYTEFFGVTEEEVQGLSWQPLVHPDDAEVYLAALLAALGERKPFHAEARVRHADGTWRWIESFAAPRLSAKGDLLGMVGSSPDITERKAAEAARERHYADEILARQATEEAEARFRGLFEGVADAILVADADGRYRDANPAAIALLGYSQDELLALRVADVVAHAPEWTAAEYTRFQEVGTWRGELELRRKDGTIVSVEALATVVSLPAGPMYLSAVRDISERKRAETERVSFLDAVAHDVKNPLTAAKGQTQLLQRRLLQGTIDTARYQATLEGIVAAIDESVALVDELLDAAHLRAGRSLELRSSPTDLVALVEAVAAETRQATTQHAIQVKTAVTELVGVWDGPRLRRVLANLLGNAVKYSPIGGEIAVRIGRETDRQGEQWAVLVVTDQGIGIPAGDVPHLFGRFRRGSNVAHIGGTGMGLAGVRQIVDQHGGSIDVVSEEGQGASFTVRLPLGSG